MRKEQCEFEKFMEAHEDDQRELEEHPADQAQLAAQIDDFIAQRMPSSRKMNEFWQQHAPAIDAEIAKRQEAINQKEKHTADLWNNRVRSNQEEDTWDKAEIFKFSQRHPKLRCDAAGNGEKLLKWLKDQNLPISEANLEEAYHTIKPSGALVEKTPEEERLERMSASEFKKMHASDWPEEQGTPPSIMQRGAKVIDTWSLSRREYLHTDSNAEKLMAALPPGALITVQAIEEAFLKVRDELELSDAVQRGKVVNFVDMGGSPAGYPPHVKKYGLMKKLEGMSADEVRERMLNDKSFESALDNLK